MAENTYEVLFLLEPNKFSADPEGSTANVNGMLEAHGGKVLFTRPWAEPKLAYPIKNFRKGSYLLTYFKAEPKAIAAIEHDVRLNDLVLRHMVIRLHPKIAEQIIAQLEGHSDGPPRPRVEEPIGGGYRGRG